MSRWQQALHADPLSWLLEADNPAARHLTLRLILERPDDDPEVVEARAQAMRSDPIATILANQHADGYWVKPGPGYSPKYTSTVWSLIFLDQLGADGTDSRVGKACEYVLSHSQAETGGFGASGREAGLPPPSYVIHCLNGNLLRALIGFGWLEDERLQRAIDWEARAITGDGFDRYYRSGTSGPRFACAANGKLPCGWGAVKALRGLARIPIERRSEIVNAAISQGVEFLLSRDPAVADYPTSTTVSSSWLKLGFPSGYIADVLQIAEVLVDLRHAKDPRLSNLVDWIVSKQDNQGRWRNRYAYNHKMWIDVEAQGAQSKWVTLRACNVLRHVFE